MPSKYSYAAVLSDYERRGLTDFGDFQRSSKSTPRAKQMSKQQPPLSQPPPPAPQPKAAPPAIDLTYDRLLVTTSPYMELPDMFDFERGRGYGLPHMETCGPRDTLRQRSPREEETAAPPDSYDLNDSSQPSISSFPPAGSYRHGGVTRIAKANASGNSSNMKSSHVKRSVSSHYSQRDTRLTGHASATNSAPTTILQTNHGSRRASIASSTTRELEFNRQEYLFEPARTSSLQSSHVSRPATSSEKDGAIIHGSDFFPSTQARRRRLTNETAIWDPKPSSGPENAPAAQAYVDRKSLAIQQPPTPPLTPKGRNSWDDFSLDSEMDELASLVEKSQLRAVSLDKSQQTPPLSISSGSKATTSEHDSPSVASSAPPTSSAAEQTFYHHSPLSRPQTPSAGSRCRLPLASLPASHPALPRSQAAETLSPATMSPLCSLSPFDLSSNLPDPFDLDADLEPLPPELCNDPEFAYLPWENPSPAHPHSLPVSRLLRHHSVSSHASSFDSAAPPPIRMNPHNVKDREEKRPTPAYPSKHMPSSTEYLQKQQQSQQQTPLPPDPTLKKPKSSSTFSFLHAVRTGIHPPKTIPYDTTKRGRPPMSVNVSRTNAPSIPALFPSYRGPFPPSSRKIPKSSGSGTTTPTLGSAKDGDARRVSISGSRPPCRPTSSRGGSAVSRPTTSRSGSGGTSTVGSSTKSGSGSAIGAGVVDGNGDGKRGSREVPRCICGSDGVKPRVVKIAGKDFIPCEGKPHEWRRSLLMG